mmetsp:Transcript_21359/g.28021  ORF Transcript_21359/g.28021 Transcript_21359/m.28021 type:complete len:279 (-) Transcript_21359:245-1081(-)
MLSLPRCFLQKNIEQFYFLKEDELYASLEKIQSSVYWLVYRSNMSRKSHGVIFDLDLLESFLSVCTSLNFLHREADLLEQYVDMNKEAFRKILKKYDKCTGECTMELLSEIRDINPFLDGNRVRRLKASVVSVIQHLETIRSSFSMIKKELVVAVGIFDEFHSGHENLLLSMKEFGHQLAVGVYDDAAAHALYGSYPNQCLESRINRLAEWDNIIVFPINSPDPRDAIRNMTEALRTESVCFVSGKNHEEFPMQFQLEDLMPVYIVPSWPSLFQMEVH